MCTNDNGDFSAASGKIPVRWIASIVSAIDHGIEWQASHHTATGGKTFRHECAAIASYLAGMPCASESPAI